MNGKLATWRPGLTALVVASALAQASCSDDDAGEPSGAGGDEPQAGASGVAGGDGDGDGGEAPAGGGTSAGATGSEPGGQPGTDQGGAPTLGEAGATASAGAAGGAGEEPCAGELVAGECLPLFALAQSNSIATGSAASSATVTLPSAVTAGNTLLLGVGVIWNGVVKAITVPPSFSLLQRSDNSTGAAAHESVVLYAVASAAAAPAQSQVAVTVDDAEARIYLALAEYAGLRASDLIDQKVSQAGTANASPGITPPTSHPNELWVVLTQSRGGIDHTNPSNGFLPIEAKKTGAGSFSFLQKLATDRAAATTSLTSSGDYASLLVTLRR